MLRSIDAALAPGVARRELLGWALYDFANSAYTTVVITAVYNAYFVASVCAGAPWATLAWTAALALSYALIMLAAPALGAYADQRAAKKRLLALLTLGCLAGTIGLAWTGPGTIGLALLLVVLSNFCFGSGENVVAAFLPELARPTGVGRISGFSWALGYLGGLAALAVCLAWIKSASARGEPAAAYVPDTMLITAAFFALGSLATFALLRERAVPALTATPGLGTLLRGGLAQTAASLRELRAFPELRRFLACIVAYQAGIQTIITLAAIYATQALGFSTEQTILMIVVVNVTAALGAAVFGVLQDRLGHRRSLLLCLAGWTLTIALLALGRGDAMFWLAANLAGFCLGAAQSAGRALVALLAPPARSAEFFGLWGLAVKAAAILGPLTYGLLSWLSGNDHRLAMLVTGAFFVAGIVLLRRVDVEAGQQRARAAA